MPLIVGGVRSKCCDFPVEVAGESPSPGGTRYYRCTLCGNPCDGRAPTKNPPHPPDEVPR